MRLTLCLRLSRLFQFLAKIKTGALVGIGYGELNVDGEGGVMKTNNQKSSNLNPTISVEVTR